MSYLEKFRGVIGKTQTEQVLRLLSNKRNIGQIRSVKEFSKELETLIRELTATGLTPTLKLYLAEGDKQTSSESYNYMLDRVDDDLTAGFLEAVEIDKVQQAHNALVRDVILKNLRAGIAELEGKIALYEYMSSNGSGFDKTIASTFREANGNRTFRGQQQINSIFRDPRTNELLDNDEDAQVELVGERLVLPEETKTSYPLHGIRQIFDSTSPQSEVLVEPTGTSISNIIDGQKGTYWVQTLLFANRKPYVRVQLEVDLGVAREINYIEIDPAIQHPITLESLYYLDVNNTFIDTGLEETVIASSGSIKIRKLVTRKLIFTFKNANPVKVDFEHSDRISLLDQALSEPTGGTPPDLVQISEALDKAISSEKIKALIGVKQANVDTFTGYAFTTGLDNIRVGFSTYASRGHYVSLPIENNDLGNAGLRATETRPYIDTDGLQKFTEITYDLATREGLDGTLYFASPDDIYFLGSIEYWVTRQIVSAAGNTLSTTSFPILPLGVNRIYHERLLLTEKSSSTKAYSDVGYTIFFTDVTNGSLAVYRNGTLLVEDTDWSLSTSATYRTPNVGERMRAKITIFSVSPGDIYTVSYDPLEATLRAIPAELAECTTVSGSMVVDLVGDLTARLVQGKEVLFDLDGEASDNTNRIYLSILLRRNTANSFLTPAVEDYSLVMGNKDTSKFEG